MKQIIVYIFMITSVTYATTYAPIEHFDLESRQSNSRFLNEEFLPIHYDIQLTPYFEAEGDKNEFTFDGIVSLRFEVDANVSTMVLNINNINIITQSLFRVGTPSVNLPFDFNVNATEQTYTITLSGDGDLSVFTPGFVYNLELNYEGEIGEEMSGFYRSYYMEGTTKKWIGTTQFQSYGARKAFPCFDEPHFKSTFQLTMLRPSPYGPTLSNTKLQSSTPIAGTNRTQDIFKITPRMSTYLIAFIVSEFDGRVTTDGTFGVHARPDAYDQTEYAFDFGQKVLSAFNTWFDYSYYSVPNVEKMDMASIPDFSAGAMENWGLLTYRETAILYDPNESTASAKQRVATVIAHEQAHMWFGDLVTCDIWEYVWLNEGFAAYFQFFVTALVENTWQLDLQYTIDHLQTIMGSDALTTTSPVTSSRGGSIVYNKASAIIRMIEHLMGTNNFQAALQQYLKDNALQTSTPEKLFDALTAKTTYDIHVIMGRWTTLPGFPVVTVELSEDRKEATITQRRFLMKNKNHIDTTKWDIPLNFVTADLSNFEDTTITHILSTTATELKIAFTDEIDWIIFNKQQTGYYRVNYDNLTWTHIGHALMDDHNNIHILNRAQIIDDVMNLARGGLVGYDIAFEILNYIKNETDYIPWVPAFNAWSYIMRRFTSEQRVEAKEYMLSLIDNIYEHLTFDAKTTDTHVDHLLRMNILSYACKYGHEECILKALAEFDKLKANANYKVPVNNRPAVYCTAIAEGNVTEFEFFWNRFKTHNVAAEQSVILTALGCAKEPALIERFIDLIATDDIRPQDKSQAFTATYSGQEDNVQVVLDYYVANHQSIAQSFGGYGNIATVLSGVAARFTVIEQIDKLSTFYMANTAAFGNSNALVAAIEDARFNLEWATNNVETILENIRAEEISGSTNLNAISFTILLFASLLMYFIN